MTDVKELLEAAHNAQEAGNALVARGYLRRASGVAPERKEIWEALLEVSTRPVDRLRCLEQIVALDPEDEAAQAALQALRNERADDTGDTAKGDGSGADPAIDDATAETPREELSALPGGHAAPVLAPILTGVRPDVTDEMRREWDAAVAAGEALHCINHPQRETTLRCNRCGAPVCTRCVVRTPVGYRCGECVKAQQSTFYTARWYDYPVAGAVAFLLSVPAAVLATLAGWWFALIVSPVAGGLIGGIVHWAVGRRRGRWTWLVVAAALVFGALVALGMRALFRSFGLISIAIYVVMSVGAATSVLRLGKRR
jgi:hypothetical protein